MRRPLMFVCDDPGRGGCAAVAHALWRGYESDATKLLVTDLAGAGEAFTASEIAGTTVDRRLVDFPIDEARPGFTRHGARQAWALLREHAPGAIVFHDSRALESTLALKRAANAARIPFLAVQHLVRPDFAPPTDLPARYLRWPQHARAVVFVSDENARRFSARVPVAPSSSLTIPNGVAPSACARPDPAARALLRHLLGADETDIALLLVGRLEPTKGQDVAIAALAAFNALGGRRARLALVGAGDRHYKRMLEAQARAAGMGACVRFCGRRNDVRALMRGADVVLQLANAEGAPLVLLEAAAEGAPILALPSGGVAEVIEGAAWMIDPAPQGLPNRIADAIQTLTVEPQRAAALGAAARARWQERFTEDTMLARHRAALNELEEVADTAPLPRLRAASCELGTPRQLDFRNAHRAWSIADGPWRDGGDGLVAFDGATLSLPFSPHGPRAFDLVFRLRATATQPGRIVEVSQDGRRLAWWVFSTACIHQRRLRLLPAPGAAATRVKFRLIFAGVPPRGVNARGAFEITHMRIAAASSSDGRE